MLRITLSKIKRVWSLVLASKCRSDTRAFPGPFHKSLVLKAEKHTKAGKETDAQCKKCKQIIEYFFAHNCTTTNDIQKIIEVEVESRNAAIQKILESDHNDTQNTLDTAVPECVKCQRLIAKAFGTDKTCSPKGMPQTVCKTYNNDVYSLQSTTAKQTEEQLAQKIEVIDETPLVESASQKIEGFNVTPKVLGHITEVNMIDDNNRPMYECILPTPNIDTEIINEEDIKTMRDKIESLVRRIENTQILQHIAPDDVWHKSIVNFATDGSDQKSGSGSSGGGSSEADKPNKFDSAVKQKSGSGISGGSTEAENPDPFDTIAKRCLNFPNSRLDERLLKEMKNLGIPQLPSEKSAIEVQMDMSRKPRKPLQKTEIDVEALKIERDPFAPDGNLRPAVPKSLNHIDIPGYQATLSSEMSQGDKNRFMHSERDPFASDGNHRPGVPKSLNPIDIPGDEATLRTEITQEGKNRLMHSEQTAKTSEIINPVNTIDSEYSDPSPQMDPYQVIIDPYDKGVRTQRAEAQTNEDKQHIEEQRNALDQSSIAADQTSKSYNASMINASDGNLSPALPKPPDLIDIPGHHATLSAEISQGDKNRLMQSEQTAQTSEIISTKHIDPRPQMYPHQDIRDPHDMGMRAEAQTNNEQQNVEEQRNASDQSSIATDQTTISIPQGIPHGGYPNSQLWQYSVGNYPFYNENYRYSENFPYHQNFWAAQKPYTNNQTTGNQSSYYRTNEDIYQGQINQNNNDQITTQPQTYYIEQKQTPGTSKALSEQITIYADRKTPIQATELRPNLKEIHDISEPTEENTTVFNKNPMEPLQGVIYSAPKASDQLSETHQSNTSSKKYVSHGLYYPERYGTGQTSAEILPNQNSSQGLLDQNPISDIRNTSLQAKEIRPNSNKKTAITDVTSTSFGPLPVMNPKEAERETKEDTSLSDMLKKVRLRNRMEFLEAHKTKVEPTGKCGKCPPPCPPPTPVCPPPTPCPPPPCPPPPPPCPRPCKSVCPPYPCPPKPTKCPPAPTPSCQPPKPCAKFTRICLEDSSNFFTTSILIKDEVMQLQDLLSTCCRNHNVTAEIQNRNLENLAMARSFEPWVPIPSWPIPKNMEKKPFVCPKEGCKERPPPRYETPCEKGGGSCIGFPKRRSFSTADRILYSILFEENDKLLDAKESQF